MHFLAITIIHVLQGTSSCKEKQIIKFEERNNFDLFANSLRVLLISISVEVVKPVPIGRISSAVVHAPEGVATIRGRIPKLVRLPPQVEPDVAAQMPGAQFNRTITISA